MLEGCNGVLVYPVTGTTCASPTQHGRRVSGVGCEIACHGRETAGAVTAIVATQNNPTAVGMSACVCV
jgi:hypothetical protein